MKFNISLKKVVCFLLAVLMLLSATACKKDKKKVDYSSTSSHNTSPSLYSVGE